MKLWIVVAALGASTMAIRATGTLVFGKRRLPEWSHAPLTLLTPVLLAALVVAQTFAHGKHLVLDARAAGVGAAVLCGFLRAPIWVVMLAAGVVTALVRWLA